MSDPSLGHGLTQLIDQWRSNGEKPSADHPPLHGWEQVAKYAMRATLYGCAEELDALLRVPVPEGPPGGWQPIATAPKDGTEVLVWCPVEHDVALTGYHHVAGFQASDGYWYVCDGSLVQPTHWRPLPSPPGAEGPPQDEAVKNDEDLKSDPRV